MIFFYPTETIDVWVVGIPKAFVGVEIGDDGKGKGGEWKWQKK